jgi:hypothetical protein
MLDGGGKGKWGRGTGRINCMAASPMGMMNRELEFEFLASRVGFFQVRRPRFSWVFTFTNSFLSLSL